MSKKILLPLAISSILVILTLFGYTLKTQKELKKIKADLQKTQIVLPETELENVTKEVGKLLVLPQDEIPTLATVTDVEILRKDQPFFFKAENGDKILVYPQAKKAILYRPNLGKIIDIAPVSVSSPSGQINVTPKALVTPK